MRMLAPIVVLLFALLAWDMSRNGEKGLAAIEDFTKDVVARLNLD